MNPYYNYYAQYCYNGHTAGDKCYSKRICRHTCTCKLLDSTNCSHSDIKLTGGKFSNEGDVQICVNGTWGYICDRSWYYSNINVVCRQLGYTVANQCKILIDELYYNYIHNVGNSYSYSSFFGGSQDIAPIVRDKFDCTGNEATLTECSHDDSYCTSVAGGYCAGINFSLF